VGDALSYKPQAFATFWPASGLMLAVLTVRKPRTWPPILAAAIAGNLAFDVLLHGRPVIVALGFVAANVCEACLGAWLLRRMAGPDVTMGRLREPAALLVAALAATAVSAFVGAATVALAFGAPLGAVWRTWWAADVLGALVVAPTILAWRRNSGPASPALGAIRIVEAGVLAVTTLVVGGFVFFVGVDDHGSAVASVRYLLFPLLLWAAVRFGPRGATLATAVVVLLAVRADTAVSGVFSSHGLSVPDRALLLQVFILVAALFAMIPAALTAEWRLTQTRLHASLGTLEAEVAERRQAQEQVSRLNEALRQSVEALEVSNRELESFSYSVSHDLRAPLRHITGFVGLLREHAPPELDPKSQHYLAVIDQAATKMGVLIDDLLAFSRMGRVDPKRELVPLGRLVEGVVEELAPEIAGRPVVWEIGLLPEVIGDPAMLRQVWKNLLGNAVKFSRTRALARISVGSAPCGLGEVQVYVRDNGVGFDMKYAAKLFQVFQRLHSSEEFEGTGIGLAIVQRIVQRHGGRAWGEGSPGHGATFWVSLPVQGG
jgi:signal transduction histidine kinase